MEPVGFHRGLKHLLGEGIEIKVVTTDRSLAIRKIMRESYPDIEHQFDTRHSCKG
jgi:hypothetical protein